MEKTGDINPKHTPDLTMNGAVTREDALKSMGVDPQEKIAALDSQDTPGKLSKCCGGKCKPDTNAKP